jgi:hypothetical protein
MDKRRTKGIVLYRRIKIETGLEGIYILGQECVTILDLHAVCFLDINMVQKFRRLFVLKFRGGLPASQ